MGKFKILNKLTCLLYAITFFRITYLTDNYSIFNKVYLALEIVCGIIIVFKLFTKNYFPKIILYELPFFVVLILSTFINSADTSECFHLVYRMLIFTIIFVYELKNNKHNFSKMCSLYLIFLVLINSLAILVYPTTMYINATGYSHNWILGYKNAHILYMVSSLLFYFIYKNGKTNLFIYLYIVLCLAFTIIVNCSTAIVTFAVMILLLLLSRNNKLNISIRTYLILFLIFFFAIVVFRVQNLFSFIIEGMLHKNITFTGRTYIWDDVIRLIKLKPFLGYGNVIYQFSRHIFTTHNQLLDIVYKTGIIGSICYVIFVAKCTIKMHVLKNKRLAKVLTIIIFSFLLAMLQEAYSIFYIIFIFVLCDNIEYLIEDKKVE